MDRDTKLIANFLPTSRQYNVVLPSHNRNLFLLSLIKTEKLHAASTGLKPMTSAMPVQCWCNAGAMLVQCWCNVGAMLVQCWCNALPTEL